MNSFVNAKRFAPLVALLAVNACTHPMKDVALTWDGAVVSSTRFGGFTGVTMANVEKHLSKFPPGTKFPTIIYMHGAGGVASQSSFGDIDIARKAGLVVIAADSFARERPENPGIDLTYMCPMGECWGIAHQIFAMRTAELAFALEQVRQLPWVDQNNLFGWGHSEGGYTMAAYPGAVFKSRIITGTGCAWGFNAEEPTLAVISQEDAYVARHHLEDTQPTTCDEMSFNAPNLTYVEIPGFVHNAVQTKEGKQAFVRFIRRHLSSSD